MKRATYILVFLFYFQSGCFGNPVAEDELTPLLIYNYHGQIEATTSASNETASRWTVSGKLSLYSSHRKVIIQLHDVKTSVFNAPCSELQNVNEKEIPEAAKVFLQPFMVTKEDSGKILMNFIPNEPLWSQNFKRGIASSLDVETDLIDTIGVAHKNNGASFKEWTLYGQCDVHYNVLSHDTAIVYEKTFDHSSCEKAPLKYKSNLFSTKHLEDYLSKTVKTTTLLEKNGTYLPHHYESKSHLKAKNLPASSYTQHIDQVTKLDLVEFKEVKLPIDISKISDKHEMTYEFGDEPTSGRHTYDNSVEGLTKQFLDNYDTFNNYFLHSPIQHIDMNSDDSIENMYLALKRLDVDGFKHLEEEISKREMNSNIFEVYTSLLPYVGTRACVKHLTTALLYNDFQSNDIFITKAMAVFPTFVENYSEELLEELEPLINNTRFKQQSARNAGPLGFASLVSHTGMSGNLKKTATNKYYKLYMERFMAGETYQERMVYLLGLINLGEVYDLHLMNHIITNTTESKHIRTLALSGFKHFLVKYSDVTKLYDMYWPIVQNQQEPFELRVGALDLLLSVNLSEEQFNSVTTNMDLNEPEGIQLANYVLTSLHSLQDTTHFHDFLGKKASEGLKHTNIPSLSTFATGNYRFALTDKDIGAYVQFRVITDPITNIINQVQITYKSYGFNYELNGYSLYLNIHGLLDVLYATKALQILTERVSSLPELLAVLKEDHYEIEIEDKRVHIDIVLFKHNTAVYAVHFDRFHRSNLIHLVEDLEQYLQPSLDIEFPLVNYVQFPSDLGTPLQFTNVGEYISYAETGDEHYKYRSTWNHQTWIESYNPLVDTNIASYKYVGSDTALKLKLKFKGKEFSFSWLNEKDTFVVYTDNILGTSVEDDNILKQYCENCQAYIGVPPDCYIKTLPKHAALGFKINVTREGQMSKSCRFDYEDTAFEFLQNDDYKSNFDAWPQAGPLMFLVHVFYHKTFFTNELSRASYHSLPFLDEDTETSVTADLDINYMLTTLNPMDKKISNFTIHVENRIVNHTDASSQWKVDYDVVWDPNYTNNNGEKNFAYFATLNIKYTAADADDSVKICAKREVFFPNIIADKYSLKPVKPSTGKLLWTVAKDLEGDDGVCDPRRIITITEHFSASDKAEKLKDKQNKKYYDECVASSKDFDYTASTKACRRISSKLTEYDNYKAYLQVDEFPSENASEIITKTFATPLLEYSRDGNDYLNFSTSGEIGKPYSFLAKTFKKSIYYPKTINPISMAYLDSSSAVPFIDAHTCTISPTTIEKFSGKQSPNNDEVWHSFAECFNIYAKALSTYNIHDNHIAIAYRSNDTVISGRVKQGKPEFLIDDDELHETYDDKDKTLKVYFLADNVINIVDKKISIYYNTEYVEIKVNKLYGVPICGLCN